MVDKFVILISLLLLFNANLVAQEQATPKDSAQVVQADSQQKTTSAKPPTDSTMSSQSTYKFLKDHGSWIVGILGLLFGVQQYLLRRKNKKDEKKAELEAEDEHAQEKKVQKAQTAEAQYIHALKRELGSVKILGSPEIDSIPVHLLDTFVSLDISSTWRGEDRFKPGKIRLPELEERNFTQENILQRAFNEFKLLLLIGDPGSGKTTLMKYFAITCLQADGYKKLGFARPVLPLFLSLRDLEPVNQRPKALHENLALWAQKHGLEITPREFYDWLHKRETLVLLDGLDEISDVSRRQEVCDWIDKISAPLRDARFIVTSRWTGYRKMDGIELACDHMRADLKDFSPEQQQEFLTKWFRAVFARDFESVGQPTPTWLATQKKRADTKAAAIISYLENEKNKGLRQLAAVPMLLQIMAILWKNRDVLPQGRTELYNASLIYLLDYRDRRRKLYPLLRHDNARRVLAPAALWMQDTLRKDEAPKPKLHAQMQETLNTMDKSPSAEDFCRNLVDRAGLIADYGDAEYVFRHKSFREYLAGLQLAKETDKKKWIKKLVLHFGDDWWEEPLRFFMNEADANTFDLFMQLFFASGKSSKLEQNEKDLLQTLVRESPQKKVDALGTSLLNDKTTEEQKRTILECLKTIGSEGAFALAGKYFEIKLPENVEIDKLTDEEIANLTYANELIGGSEKEIELRSKKIIEIKAVKSGESSETEGWKSFRNPHELNAEYILIPGGEFEYSVTRKIEKIPDLYFAKYPVTNKRYRRFIAYLAQKEKPLLEILPHAEFVQSLNKFAGHDKAFIEYLGDGELYKTLRSNYDDDKKWNEEDQPVVGVTWYAASAYCFWLSCLQAPGKIDDINKLAQSYRLPTEPEWEWAAAGREKDGSLRKYPWPGKLGEPTKDLANYNRNVGKTTPVGRFPKGATPEGLHDMAGNAWEWMANRYDEDKDVRALRGGSWHVTGDVMRCAARDSFNPSNGSNNYGFRVVSASPVFETL